MNENMSIVNFILDIGNVLISFNPHSFLQSLLGDPETEKKMLKTIFMSPEWAMADKGTITREDACMVFCEREPRYESVIKQVMDNLTDMLEPLPDTVALLPKIKAAGHKLFYLSNYSVDGSRFIRDEYSFFNYFDGGIFSCDVHITKPDIEIYKLLLDKFRLTAVDCLFFDDIEENVAAAESAGMKGILFTDASDIEVFI